MADTKQGPKENGEKRITLSLPGDTPVPVPGDQWQRVGDRIIATYSREELVIALGMAGQITGPATKKEKRATPQVERTPSH